MTQRGGTKKPSGRKPKYRFTKEDCQRGYRAALDKCMEDWNVYAWLFLRNYAVTTDERSPDDAHETALVHKPSRHPGGTRPEADADDLDALLGVLRRRASAL